MAGARLTVVYPQVRLEASVTATGGAADTNAVSFRVLSKMSPKERDAAIAAGVLGLELSDWVEGEFRLPKTNLLINPAVGLIVGWLAELVRAAIVRKFAPSILN